MVKFGRKFTCYSCHTKFYDLGKDDPTCPKCRADPRDAEAAPVTTSHRRAKAVAPAPVVVVEEP
ncbi:MAG TPA: FYDLN acid domain-containing protein, partial [Thermoanaerobaculia bacterium]